MSIYIITDKSHFIQNQFKIGQTKYTSKKILQSYNRALVDPQLVFHHRCSNHESVEKLLHKKLDEYRINKTQEWFNIDYFKMLKIVINILESNDINCDFTEMDEIDKIINKLTIKQLNLIGVQGKTKKDMLNNIKNNLDVLYLLEDNLRMKITETKTKKDSILKLNNLIYKIRN